MEWKIDFSMSFKAVFLNSWQNDKSSVTWYNTNLNEIKEEKMVKGMQEKKKM